MKDADWTTLWRQYARKKSDHHKAPLRVYSGHWVCSLCHKTEEHDGREIWANEHSYVRRSLEYTDPHQFKRFAYRHNVACARQAVRALYPVASIIAAFSAADRDLESKLMAVSERDTASAAVLEDFYLEKNFLVAVKGALRAAKRKADKEAKAAAIDPVLIAGAETGRERECDCVDVVGGGAEYVELCPRHAMGPRFAAVQS